MTAPPTVHEPPRTRPRGVVAWAVVPAAFALGTVALGWPAVPLTAALVAGVGALLGPRFAPGGVALAAAGGWLAVLGVQLTGPRAAEVARALGGLANLSPVAATAVAALLTLALAALLAWSAATLGEFVATRLVRRPAARGASADAAPGRVTLPAPGQPAAPAGPFSSAPSGPSAASP